MLISQRVTSTDSAYFPALDALYGRAFPWHEQREAEAKQQALDNPHYVLEAWFDDGLFIGLSGCWRFADYSYIEHLAIDDTLRSRGYGKRLLAEILQRAPLTILEIDPLTSEIAHKRLRFYAGFAFGGHGSGWCDRGIVARTRCARRRLRENPRLRLMPELG